MTNTVNAGDHKERFNELQPDDQTQAEFLRDCLDAYEIVDDSGIDVEEILELIDLRLGTQVELATHRGVQSGLEKYIEDHEILVVDDDG
jgi:hypothetical protein